MKDIKSIVSANLAALRKQKGVTQAELAEKLNYSDKAISRWEKGDTLPDLNVLYEICEFYGITMNDLTSKSCVAPKIDDKAKKLQRTYRLWICILAAASIMLFASLWFIFNLVAGGDVLWIAFLWAIPCACAVFMLIGRTLFNWIVHFVLGSVTLWSTITATVFHIQFFTDLKSGAVWLLFILGIPLQAMLFFFQMAWKSRVKVKNNKEEEKDEDRTEEPSDVEGEGN